MLALASSFLVSNLAFLPPAAIAASDPSSLYTNVDALAAARAASIAHRRSVGESEIVFFNRFASGLEAVLITRENALMYSAIFFRRRVHHARAFVRHANRARRTGFPLDRPFERAVSSR